MHSHSHTHPGLKPPLAPDEPYYYLHDHEHQPGHHGDPKVNVLDDTKCVAEGCEKPATKQREVSITLPGLESGEIFQPKTQVISVPVCDEHYDFLDDLKTGGFYGTTV